MATSLFDSVCQELERRTGLERLAMRGTVRLALKSVGLDPATLSRAQLELVARQVLPDELSKRGVADAGRICAETLGRLPGTHATSPTRPESPDEIFRRLGAR
jgi:hypothetical protein